MIYYRKLDIPDFEMLRTEALNFVLKRDRIFNRSAKINLITADLKDALFEIPHLSMFDQYGIKVTRVLFFVLYKNSQCGIHSDSWENDARINIPIINCSESILEFWENVEWTLVKNSMGTNVKIAKTGTGTLCDVVEIDTPTVIRVNEPHRVVMKNESLVPRITMSLDFDKCPSFLL